MVLQKKQEEKRDKHVVEIQTKQQQQFNSLITSPAGVGVKAQEDAIRAEKEVRRRQRAYAQRGCQRQRHVLGQGGLDVRGAGMSAGKDAMVACVCVLLFVFSRNRQSVSMVDSHKRSFCQQKPINPLT